MPKHLTVDNIGTGLTYNSGTGMFSVTGGTGGSATPAGADREIQFNNAGAFGASSMLKMQADGYLNLNGGVLYVTAPANTDAMQLNINTTATSQGVSINNTGGINSQTTLDFKSSGVSKGRWRVDGAGSMVFASAGTTYFGYSDIADGTDMRFGGTTSRMHIYGSTGDIAFGTGMYYSHGATQLRIGGITDQGNYKLQVGGCLYVEGAPVTPAPLAIFKATSGYADLVIDGNASGGTARLLMKQGGTDKWVFGSYNRSGGTNLDYELYNAQTGVWSLFIDGNTDNVILGGYTSAGDYKLQVGGHTYLGGNLKIAADKHWYVGDDGVYIHTSGGSSGLTGISWRGTKTFDVHHPTDGVLFNASTDAFAVNRQLNLLSTTTAPTVSTTNGSVYYNGTTNRVNVWQPGGWKEVAWTTDVSVPTLQQVLTAGNTANASTKVLLGGITDQGSYNLQVGGNAYANGNMNVTGGYAIDGDVVVNYNGDNIALGAWAGMGSGWDNVSLGNSAMGGITSGGSNVAVGTSSFYTSDGSNNTGVGTYSGRYLTGGENTAIGSSALTGAFGVSTGVNYNTAIGFQAGTGIRTGASYNTFIGWKAGSNISTGLRNILIGQNIQGSSATVNDELNIGGAIKGNLSTGAITLPNLAGADTRMVVVTSGGTLSTQAIPAGGSGVTDGDKGDIVVSDSGATWTADAATVVKISGTQTITGTKTFSSSATFQGGVNLMSNGLGLYPVGGNGQPRLSLYLSSGTGVLELKNASSEDFSAAITSGVLTASRTFTLPDAAGTVATREWVSGSGYITASSADTLTNKSIAASQLTGTVATARLGSGTASVSTYLRGDQTWATDGDFRSFTLVSPTSSENLTMFYTRRAITVTSYDCTIRGTSPSVTWALKHDPTRTNTGTNVFTATNTAAGSGTGSVSVPANSWIWFTTSATSGTVDDFHITITFTYTS